MDIWCPIIVGITLVIVLVLLLMKWFRPNLLRSRVGSDSRSPNVPQHLNAQIVEHINDLNKRVKKEKEALESLHFVSGMSGLGRRFADPWREDVLCGWGPRSVD